MHLTKDFTLDEFIVSEYAERHDIDNLPPPEAVEHLRLLCVKVLQPLRDHLARPIVVTSGYRSPDLNAAIGGSLTSQHMKGQAADIVVPGVHPVEVVSTILHLKATENIYFDQLIQEFGRWVHVSYDRSPRFQVLIAYRHNGATVFQPWEVRA